MRSVEIERLLQWAFCDELPKREAFGPRGAPSAWQSVENYAKLGCRVQSGSSVSHSAIPHRDALIIADAVAALPGGVVVDLSKEEALLGGLSSLAAAIVAPQIRLSAADLVEDHARSGVSPDWCRHQPRPMCVIGPNGKQTVFGKRYGKDRYSEGAHCPLRWGDPTIESIARARAIYTIWWQSLDRLSILLNGKLKDHVASAPAALRAPWLRPH